MVYGQNRMDFGRKKVIVLSLLSAVLSVALNLVNLYVAPSILSAVERHVPVGELMWTIGEFVLGLMFVSAASEYVNVNTLYGRISVRREIVARLNRKAATTSYPNLDNDQFRKLMAKSRECVKMNKSATEAVWTTLTTLSADLLGFLVYISLLTSVQPILVFIIILTAGSSYFIGNHVNGYEYRHREEEAEYERHMTYLSERARDLSAAKDIRIFGLRSWFSELYTKAMEAYTSFHRRAQGVYIWAKIADLVLTFLRNAVIYWYLVRMVIKDGLDVAEFLLFFTAASGFGEWVFGILREFHILYRQSLDISTVRECLEFDEPFTFEAGRTLRSERGRKYEIRLEHVSFRYPGADKNTLTDINLTLHPGERLAVVGLNGAGKTTLVYLICGLLDPTEGRVLLDGTDIRDFAAQTTIRCFPQYFRVFPFWPERLWKMSLKTTWNLTENVWRNVSKRRACGPKWNLCRMDMTLISTGRYMKEQSCFPAEKHRGLCWPGPSIKMRLSSCSTSRRQRLIRSRNQRFIKI